MAMIDVRGLYCPLPVLEARKSAETLEPGDRLKVLGDDPMMKIDFPHWCHGAGHRILSLRSSGGDVVVEIEIGETRETGHSMA